MTDNENDGMARPPEDDFELTEAEQEQLAKILGLAAEQIGGRVAATGNVTYGDDGTAAIALSVYRDTPPEGGPELGVINFSGRGKNRPKTVAEMLDQVEGILASTQQTFADMAGIEFPLGEPAGTKDLRNMAQWFRDHPKVDAQVMRYLDRELGKAVGDVVRNWPKHDG